jgi:Zn finger protein HypA/HybF involved in hydrogenase expression
MKPTQGALWCRVCNGSGTFPYIRAGKIKMIPCPLCKGTTKDTSKGKAKLAA